MDSVETREQQLDRVFTLQDAQDDARVNYTPPYISKPPSPLPLKGMLQGEYCDSIAADRIKVLGHGRDASHCARLLSKGRSEAEREFAYAYIENSRDVWLEEYAKEKRSTTMSIIGAEGPDTMMWWTFAPYIYQELVWPSENLENGLEPSKAIRAIMHWAKTGDRENVRSYSVLKGMDSIKGLYVLGSEPKGASHLFTQQEARRIAKEVFNTITPSTTS